MAFLVFENADQGATFVVALITMPICVLVTTLRFVVIWRAGRKTGIEDWFAFLALFPYLAWSIYGLVLVVDVENGTKSIFQYTEFDPTVWKNTIITGYVLQIFFGPQQTLAKLSLLVFYHRVFSVSKTFTRLAYFVGTLQISYCITWLFTSIFMCNPPAKTWDPLLPGSCLNLSVVLAATESVNSLIDFIMVGMAIYIVRKLNIARVTRWKLLLLFGFGGLTGVLGFVRIGMAYGTVGDSDHVLVYMILQMASSIICCCLPIYRAAFVDLPIFKKLRSKFRSTSASDRRDGSSAGRPEIRTIGQITTNDRKLRSDDEWLQLDEASSTHHLATSAWADKEHRQRDFDPPAYPMQTVEFRQSVEVV